MDSLKFATKVQNAMDIYRHTKQHPSDLDATKHLYYAICDIEHCVTSLNTAQTQLIMGDLVNAISKMRMAPETASEDIIQDYKTAIAYLEYYSHCRLNYFLSSDRQGTEFLFNNIYNASDYPMYFFDDTYSSEQQYYIKNILLNLEAEAIRDHAQKVAGVNNLVLYGFNDKIVCEHLVTQKYAQIAITGPLTRSQNESFEFYKFNLKAQDGTRYGTKGGRPYDQFAYATLADNCSAATVLQNYFIHNFKQIAASGKFKGCLHTFSGQELQDFAQKCLANFEHQLLEIKGCQMVNAQQSPKFPSLPTESFGN